jgi:hypothetical protein
MRTQGSKRFVLPVCGILVLLVVGLARTIRREMRRQERNQALIAAVKAAQAQTVQELLHQGADPDAIEIPPQKVSLWNFLRERIRGLKGEHTGMPALALASPPWKRSTLSARFEEPPQRKDAFEERGGLGIAGGDRPPASRRR